MLNNKNTIRKNYFEKRMSLTEKEILFLSERISIHAYTNFFLFSGRVIGIYYPINKEVDPRLLKNLGEINTAFPFIEGEEMVFKKWDGEGFISEGKKNIPSPPASAPTVVPNIIIAPLVAFDEEKNRIGYGKGFYDKYLQNFEGITIGFAFEMQKVEHIPAEKFDVKLDYIITEDKIY